MCESCWLICGSAVGVVFLLCRIEAKKTTNTVTLACEVVEKGCGKAVGSFVSMLFFARTEYVDFIGFTLRIRHPHESEDPEKSM